MFANKSTTLLGRIKHARLLYGDEAILCATYKGDTRYMKDSIVTHDLQSIPCLGITSLDELFKDARYCNAKVIFLEEGQFFTGLTPFVKKVVELDKKQLTIVGLSATYLRDPFYEVVNLVALADDEIKLNAICMRCRDGTPAIFNQRITEVVANGNQDSLIGGIESYESVCRSHYLEI